MSFFTKLFVLQNKSIFGNFDQFDKSINDRVIGVYSELFANFTLFCD